MGALAIIGLFSLPLWFFLLYTYVGVAWTVVAVLVLLLFLILSWFMNFAGNMWNP